MLKLACSALILCVLCSNLHAQDNIKFGKVTAADFNIQSSVIDSNTNVVVLADIGNSRLDGNTKGWFSLIYKRTRRLKVLNKNGFDAADVSVMLYTARDGDEEKLTDCKAITYNLENGAVQQTRLESSSIFKEKKDRNHIQRKFTFPNVKVGSILEYTYTIESDFLFNLQPWEFQGEYPRVLSQYTVSTPEFFRYVFLSQGFVNLKNTKKDRYKTYMVSESQGAQATEHYSISGNETEWTWTANDVPALKEEPYTSSIDNYNSKINFQLASIQFPNNPPRDQMGTWQKASEDLLKREDFGVAFTRPNNWLNDDVKSVKGGASTDLETGRKIFTFVRDNFTVTNSQGLLISDGNSLKEVFRKKSGTEPEINLLLIAMLRNAGISADPVLLSTRDNGFANAFYPLISKFNYVICRTNIDGKTYLLDATQHKLGFGRLSPKCYNGFCFTVKETPANFSLEADSLKESKTTLVFLVNGDKGGLNGTFRSDLGYYESEGVREKLVTKSQDDFFKDIAKTYSSGISIHNKKIDSLQHYDVPVNVNYDIAMDFNNENILYINPMFSEGTTKNPFSSADRKYPVEMPYTVNETYVLNMEIPKGYKVDEIPKSTRVKLNENEGMFEYLVSATEDRIMLQSRISIKKALFEPEDYQALRDMFALVAKKHSEQIVLKKIN